MVCGFLADHISTAGSPMDRDLFLHRWPARGVRVGAIDCSRPAGHRRLPVLPIMGERTSQQLCRRVQRVFRSGGISGLLSWTALDYALSRLLPAGAAVLL